MLPWWHHVAYAVCDFFLAHPFAPCFFCILVGLGCILSECILWIEGRILKRK